MRTKRSLMAASILALASLTTAVNLHADSDDDGDGPDKMAIRPHAQHQIFGTPRNGAPAGAAVVTGNGINYNGGPVMHPVNLYFILYGNWPTLDAGGPALLEKWAQNIAPSPYFNINTSYGDSTGASVPDLVTFEGAYTDTGSLGNSLTDSNIATLASNAINHGFAGSPSTPANPDPNGLYMILTAPGVAETSGFLSQYCGWHWSGDFIKGAITAGMIRTGFPVAKFAFIGDAAGPSLGNCAVQSTSPNNDAGADGMISVMAHELSETSTDPDGNAWYSSNGEENADLCAWNFGTVYTTANGSFANVNLNGTNFLMQQLWLNANGGRCAISYATTPNFSVSVSGPQTVVHGTASGSYTLTATPSNGFAGTVSWTFAPPSGITVAPPSGLTGNSATFTLTAASSLAAGTYSIPVTGTSGSLSHTVNATLVVTAPVPTFSLSITPGSKAVTRPPRGSVTATYTVSITAINGFAEAVTLSASGGTTGVTPSISGTNPVSPGGSGTLSVLVTNSAQFATRTLTVTGSAAGVTNKTATATITISQ